MQEAGRPVLVGTISVEKSEMLGEMLKRRGIKHEVLNAKFHEKEAGIVAQAGRTGAVTIATNMAGRGTDILLGGNPAGLASRSLHKRGINPAEVDTATYDGGAGRGARPSPTRTTSGWSAAGGLHIIGTERHDARRIDNQLRGRAGRQGDPGSSRFYLSLEDDLMKRFASDRVAGLMERMGLEEDIAIESRLVSQDDRERPDPRRGLQLRHPQARRRVRRRHQQAARDDLRRARQGPAQRGPDRDGPAFLDDEIEALVDTHLVGDDADDWDFEGLAAALDGDGPRPATGTTRRRALGARRPRRDHRAPARPRRRASSRSSEAEVGEADWAQVERLVLLRTIDSLWVEHLTELDDMRRGIGLRGYGQQDPLNEFKREAFKLYEELRGFIRHASPPRSSASPSRASRRRQRRPGRAAGPRRWRGGPAREWRDGRRVERRDGAAAASAATAGVATRRRRPARRRRWLGDPARRAPRGRRRARAVARIARRRGRRGASTGRAAAAAAGAGGARPGFTPTRRADRPQRPVLVRLGRQVQEVPRPLSASRTAVD